MNWQRCLMSLSLCLGLTAWPIAQVSAQPSNVKKAIGPDAKQLKPVVDKALDYLRKRQAADPTFGAKQFGPGVAGLVVVAALRNGCAVDDPLVAKTLALLEQSVKPDGGIYDKGLANYTTSVAMMSFQEANRDGKYNTLLKNASAFLKSLQHADTEDIKFGGAGYDSKSRPDLSNTHMFLESLLAAGVKQDDPAVQNALKFIGKCQNLPGETNPLGFAKKTTDDDKGGLVYTPIGADDEKNPNRTPDGGLRSLGAMTYAGLKSFLYAGVKKDDQRVQGAIRWIRAHYTLEGNPGYKSTDAGLYYYYHTFAKAMTAWGEDEFADSKGTKHDWRAELFEALKKRQQADGSWVNVNDRTFGEASPDLATAFALLSLSYCGPTK